LFHFLRFFVATDSSRPPSVVVPTPHSGGRAVGRYFFTTHARIIVAPSRERVGIINY